MVVVFFFALILALGMNPYLMPGYYDDALYYSLGRSIFNGEGYQFMGTFIVDWPPLFSAMLAGAFAFFGVSITVAKVMTAAFAVMALFMLYLLLKKEDRPYIYWTLMVMASLPVSLTQGTRIATDWPYIFFSFACLYALEHLRTHRSLILGVLAGAFFGCACLIRYVGLALGVTLIFQCVSMYRQHKEFKSEAVALLIGGASFLGWIAYLFFVANSEQVSLQEGDYQAMGWHMFSSFNVNGLAITLSDLFFKLGSISGNGLWATVFGWFIIFMVTIGYIQQVRLKNIKTSDVYALIIFFLLTSMHEKLARFFLVIFPFLFIYFIQGCQFVFRINSLKFVTVWIIFLLAIDAHLLFRGDHKYFNGLSPLVSKTGSEFYRGDWKCLYEASQKIKGNKSCVVGIDPSYEDYVKYIHAWTGCRVVLGAQGAGVYIDKR